MRGAWRRSIFAVPFGCLVAIGSHFVRFGDEHAFGGTANETLVCAAVSGATAVALAIVYTFITSGTTTTTGTLAASRAMRSVPGAATIFAVAAVVYYSIEALEGSALEIGLPTLILAALAFAIAGGLRRAAAACALCVAAFLRDWLTIVARRLRGVRVAGRPARPLHSGITRLARRPGRAPPSGRHTPIPAR